MVRAAISPAPIVAAPSQYWDGIDGPWSTAQLRIGTPSQDVRVIVSTAGQETWVVLPQGCDVPSYGSNCAASRGRLFTYSSSTSWMNASSIWNNTGIYQLGTIVGYDLGLTGNGFYGFDTVSPSWQTGNVTLNHTVVAGIATDTYWLGQFGISPRPTNFTVTNDNSSSYEDPQPSYLSLLKQGGYIPSLSYGFNPGSFYRSSTSRNAFMTLIFGGYDASRFVPNSVKFTFAPDNGRELAVVVQSIQKSIQSNYTSLLNNAILARLDSSQPYMWLPLASCKLFEQAFGLQWNNDTQMYLVNDTLHEQLIAENSSIAFKLTNGIQDNSGAVDIVFSYGNFALQASPPLVSNSSRYFPLKRAANESQYVLGRSFLQEVYLAVDYERNVFNVSQATWSDTAAQDIRVISSPATPPDSPQDMGKLSPGAIVGIVLGVIAVVAIAALIGFFALRHIRKRRNTTEGSVDEKTDQDAPAESESKGDRDELDGAYYGKHEMSAHLTDPSELEGGTQRPAEVEGEMYLPTEVDGTARRPEMEGDAVVYELPADSRR